MPNGTLVLVQELKLVFPGAQRMNRGRHEVEALVRACKVNCVTDLLVVHEHRGTPGMAGWVVKGWERPESSQGL